MGTLACRWRVALSVLSLAVFTSIVAQTASAAVVVVGTCKTSVVQFTSISAAITAVPAGSTIYICPGTYAEQLLINKNLTLTGVSSDGLAGVNALGANNPVLVAPAVLANIPDLAGGQPIYYQIAAVNPTPTTPIKVNISSLAVDGSNSPVTCGDDLVGIYYQNVGGTINQVVTRYQELPADSFGCQGGLAIYVVSGYGTGGTAAVTISNNSVHDYDKNGITVDGGGTNATISGNYVVGIGATPLVAQNGIQVSDAAIGSVKNNTVTDDVYINPVGGPYWSASGILIYDSSGIVISGNTVSNTQGGIVTYGDSNGTADNATVTSNKVTASPAAGIYQIDGIDLCSNNNNASLNTVYNSSGAGIHIDSQCVESTGGSGYNTTVTKNTINEACAGVIEGTGTGNSIGSAIQGTLNTFFNVVTTLQTNSDACPVGLPNRTKIRLKPNPWRP